MSVRAKTMAFVVLAGCLDGGTLSAHHPVADNYDTGTVITLRGMTAMVFFGAPHSYLALDVQDNSGRVTRWVVEGDERQKVMSAGLTRAAASPGTILTVTAFAPKAGASLVEAIPSAPQAVLDAAKAGRLAHGLQLLLPDGRKIGIGQRE